MSLFLRDYRILVGTEGSSEGREISSLQIRFKIVRSTNAKQNKAQIDIFNLSPATRAVFETSDDDTNNPVIIFQTRYLYEPRTPPGDGFQTLFTGRVVNALTTKRDADMITQVEAADGYVPIRDGVTARNFPAGTSRRSVLNQLIADLGVPLGEIRDGGDLNQRFENGVTFEGPIQLAIDRLLNPLNIEWSIQDDSFVAIRRDLASDESVLDLSPQTGLIGSPQARKSRSNRVKSAENESDYGVIIESLLSPAIRPNRRIRVTSNEFNPPQIFKVSRVTHEGDFRGEDWKSRTECVELGG